MKRIFIAVDISAEAREKAARYVEVLKKEFSDLRVGWEKPEKLHLTLKFLGDVDDKLLGELNDALENSVNKLSGFKFDNVDFRLEISGTGVFPNAKRPRVLWLGIKDESGVLKRMNEILETECERIGFERENRKFSPHLTIGRIREPQISQKLAARHLQNEFEPVEFDIAEIVIYESKLQPTGSVYTKLKTFELLV